MRKFLLSLFLILSLFFSFGNLLVNAEISKNKQEKIQKILNNYFFKKVEKIGLKKTISFFEKINLLIEKNLDNFNGEKRDMLKYFYNSIDRIIEEYVGSLDIKGKKYYGEYNLDNKKIKYSFLSIYNPLEKDKLMNSYDELAILGPLNYKITYKCNGGVKQGVITKYCKTNGKDYLEQYELSNGLVQYGCDGPYLSWHKIYIKKVGDYNFFFETQVGENVYGVEFLKDKKIYDDTYLLKEDKEKYKKIVSEEYLKSIINTGEYKEKEKKWRKFVKSFKLEK